MGFIRFLILIGIGIGLYMWIGPYVLLLIVPIAGFILACGFVAWCMHQFNGAVSDVVDDELKRRGRY